jgi:hypothetical protein
MATRDGELLEKVFYVFAKKIKMATWDGELLELLLHNYKHRRILGPKE